LRQLKVGCKQILEYKGMTKQTAFEGLTISGFYKLLELFHYKAEVQEAFSENNYFIDRIIFQHVVTGNEIVLFNKVSKTNSKISFTE